MKILSSSMFGNIVGIISFVIGLISLFITIKTLKTAQSIKNEIKNKQIEAIKKSKFYKNKHIYIDKLKQKRNAVVNQGIVSKQICNQVISVLNDILASNIVNHHDLKILEKDKSKLNKIIADDKIRKANANIVGEFDSIIADIIAVLENGEYEL